MKQFTNLIQKITLYESRDAYYVLGSDESETNFRMLEISRNERKDLVIHSTNKTYSLVEIQEYLGKIKLNEKKKSNNAKVIAYGYSIAGFVRFTEGYYMILVTSRQRVAVIGSHTIYKVEGTSLIYIPNDKSFKQLNSEEQRYAKLFENVDFSNNFYFSYSYDLTHTLQYNQTDRTPDDTETFDEARQKPAWKYVWNEYLLEPIIRKLHPDWMVHFIHGFLSQYNMVVYGRHIYMTLIARRSNKYAGTRFQKRGCNAQGDVGNEVETEQIVYDASGTGLNGGAYTSFVQLRGSVPLYWSQDITKVMRKPPISMDFSDPYGEISSRHLRALFKRYGAPILLLSLVKRREKKKRESLLWDEMVQAIDYLNQFLLEEQKIRYVAFDMARSNNKKGSNVLSYLDNISEKCIGKTGFYVRNFGGKITQRQHGVIRTNCVDCLDRTNTAQFAVGKHALGLQLNALGVTSGSELLFDTDCVRMLEILYEDQGDTIALQYGGSNLVHRVQSYRKTDPLYTHTNDILTNLSRYYNNSFSDAEKQQAFNVFLGIYRPYNETIPLWDLSSDTYIHKRTASKKCNYTEWLSSAVAASLPTPYDEVHKEYEIVARDKPVLCTTDIDAVYRTHELTSFENNFSFHIPNSINNFMPKNISISENVYNMSPFMFRKTVRWKNFLVSAHQRRKQKAAAHDAADVRIYVSLENDFISSDSGDKPPEPVKMFNSGTVTEDLDSSSSEESDIEYLLTSDDEETSSHSSLVNDQRVSFHDILDDPSRTYGVDLDSYKHIKLYANYERIYRQTNEPSSKKTPVIIQPKSIFPMDSVVEVTPPTVNREMSAFYKHVVTIGQKGTKTVPKANQRMYEHYVQQLFM